MAALSDRAALLIEEERPMPGINSGTKAIFAWSEWVRLRGFTLATARVSLQKGDEKLIVHEYGPHTCGVLKMGNVFPHIQEFREWRQPLSIVLSKLKGRGWTETSSSKEAGYVH